MKKYTMKDAYNKGAVFLLDEVDSFMDPKALTLINAWVAEKYGTARKTKLALQVARKLGFKTRGVK